MTSHCSPTSKFARVKRPQNWPNLTILDIACFWNLKALADVLEQQNDLVGAIQTCERAISLIEETNLITTTKSELYLRLGISLMRQRDFGRALDSLFAALKASVAFERDDSIYEANNELGNLF